MGIPHIEEAKELRKEGKRLGRAGLSQRVLVLLEQYKDPSYKKAIELAGRLHAIALAARTDSYWSEKCGRGYEMERHDIKIFEAQEVKNDND